MTRTIEARFEKGIFRPNKAFTDIPDHSQVRLQIETMPRNNYLGPLSDCIGIMSDEDAAELTCAIKGQFDRIDTD